MFKRVALVAGSVAAIVMIRRKAKAQQAEQDLWSQATDDVASATPRPQPSPTPQPAPTASIDEPPKHS